MPFSLRMHGRHMLIVLTVTALGLALDQAKPKPSTGIATNHLRTVDPDTDDSEYLKIEATGDKKHIKKPSNKSNEEEKPKTLSQQIADGKYALIQKEIFSKPQNRPGILSYDDNPEVPNDNINNLGGLDKNEIWLAENHLVVLRGGGFPDHDDRRDNGESPWAPLDSYKAPLRQVKIPKNPKIPPPFPVQLYENGPLQILGTNFTRTINGTYEEALNAIPPPEGYPPPPAPTLLQSNSADPTNSAPRPVAVPISGYAPPGEFPGGLPLPPFHLNGTSPPSLGYLPPGAVVLPPPGNQSDYIDYDDPSIYYPPPYSFYYAKDNSSRVPAGPLVPGIILPPPPNFFAPLEDINTTTSTRKPQRGRKPSVKPTAPPTTTKKVTSPPKTVKIYPVKNHQYINEVKHTTTARPIIKSVTIVPEVFTVPQKPKYQPTQRKKPGVTILKPINPAQDYDNEISNKPFSEYGPPDRGKISVTTTAVPLRYHTTSNNNLESNSISQNIENREKFRRGKAKTTIRPTQYYFYEEQDKNVEVPTKTYTDNNEPYYVRPKPIVPVRQRRPQYVYVTAKPYNTQKPRFRFIQQPISEDSFSIHINKLKNQIDQYYTTTFRSAPKPVYQFSFQAANYRSKQTNFNPQPEINQQNQFQQVPAKYTVEIQQAIEIIPTESPVFYQHSTQRPFYQSAVPDYQEEVATPSPKYVQNVATPLPISEYSFEATPNPLYQGYYTKPDENYFDDRTKTYFTMFGRKLPSATTPIPRIVPSPSPLNTYRQRPISLEGDTSVNYIPPRPTINPDAESIPNVVNSHPKETSEIIKAIPQNNYLQRPISLKGDTSVNYISPRPAINPDAEIIPNVVKSYPKETSEIIRAIPIEVPSSETQDSSFISYQLPGDDGAHFYFLTPQLAQRKEQGAGFYYSKARRRRNEKTVDVER